MKQLLSTQFCYAFITRILPGMLLTSSVASAQVQQENININVGNVYNNVNVTGNRAVNVRNINTVVSTGPNGLGNTQTISVNIIDNGTGFNSGGPNVRGYTSSLITNQNPGNQLANKPKPKRPAAAQAAKPNNTVAATSAVQRPKPKPGNATPRRTVVRSSAPVVAAPAIAAPVVVEQMQAQSPVSNPLMANGNQLAVVAQVMNDDVNVQTMTNVQAVSAPAINLVNAPAVRSSAASGGSGSSGKSHRSGRKKHGSFYYNTNKKMMKLFAKNKNRKFDPAKCFVWK